VTTKDFVLLILGALAGAVASAWYNALKAAADSRTRQLRIRRRQGLAASGAVAKGVIAYYQKLGAHDKLYVPTMVGPGAPVGAVGVATAGFPVSVLESDQGLLSLQDNAVRDVLPYEEKLINAQKGAGARIFDGEILYVKDRRLDGNRPNIVAGRCNFYSYASLTLRLQAEVVRKKPSTKYKEFLLSLSPYGTATVQPQAIGCSCVTVFESERGPVLAVSNRSPDVVTSGSSRATLPSFGMETNAVGRDGSRFGLLYHNFIREFAEEFFDLEELVHMMMSRRSDPDWMFQLRQVQNIHDQATAGMFDLKCLGMSCNPHDGALNFNLLGHFKAVEFYQWVKRESRANWESASSSAGAPPIEFVGLGSPLIDDWVAQGQIHGCSVASIDLARRYFADAAS
jgi:hypothetical protein